MKKKVFIYLSLFFYALLWGFLLSGPFSAFDPNAFSIDQSIFQLMGKTLRLGGELYIDAWDHKGPLLYIVYALADFISPNQVWGILLLQSLAHFITLVYTYKIAQLYLSDKVALVVPFLLPCILGAYGAQPTELLLCLQIYSLYLFLDKIKKDKTNSILTPISFCATAALFMKFNLCAFWFPIFISELYLLTKHQGMRACLKQLAKSTIYISFCCVLIFCFVNFSAMWDAYIDFNLSGGLQGQSALLNPSLNFVQSLHSRRGLFTFLEHRMPYLHVATAVYLFLSFIVTFPAKRQEKWIYLVLLATVVLTVLSCFRGTMYFRYYYVTLHPFYILSLIFTIKFICNFANKQYFLNKFRNFMQFSIILSCILCTTILAYAIHVQLKERHQAQDNMRLHLQMQAKDRNSILLIQGGLDTWVYSTINKLPLTPHFFDPPPAYTKTPKHIDESIDVINSGRAQLVIWMSDVCADRVKEALDKKGYTQIETPTPSDQRGRHLLYFKRD